MCGKKFVCYYRVSTQKQGKSGLGLDAQRSAVEAYVRDNRYVIVADFTEVESGKRDDRPELHKAVEACRTYGATLLIAKLDRLSRDAHFLLGLEKAGVDIVAADMPNANRLTVGIMAMVAEDERERISARTKVALAAAKKRGTLLGGIRPGQKVLGAVEAAQSLAKRQLKASERAERLKPIIESIKATGIKSYGGIARELTARGVPAPRGGEWQAVQVQRLGV
jgi:DNA invertase Pin-like site-specific DNA recombinase